MPILRKKMLFTQLIAKWWKKNPFAQLVNANIQHRTAITHSTWFNLYERCHSPTKCSANNFHNQFNSWQLISHFRPQNNKKRKNLLHWAVSLHLHPSITYLIWYKKFSAFNPKFSRWHNHKTTEITGNKIKHQLRRHTYHNNWLCRKETKAKLEPNFTTSLSLFYSVVI